LKHLKATLDGRAAYQIKDLDESDPAKAFVALRAKLLSHFGSPNEASSAHQQFCHRTQSEGEAIGEYVDALLKLSKAGWPGQQRDTDLQSQIVQGLRLLELKEYLRLQFADLGFEETVKKARFYMEVKDTSKSKKASVRFTSTERDPAVNAITSSTVDLEPVMNCLKSIENRMDKMERRGQPARAPTPPSRSTSPAPSQLQNNQRSRSSPRPRNDNAGYQRDQFEDQQPQRFDDVPPQNYPASPQPRRLQTPPVGWSDVNYQPPTQAWGGADPRFQGTPPWWINLDSGAQVSVLPSALADEFDPPVPLPSVTREVRTFGNHQVVLRGLITLDLQLCGFRTRHPFYFIDASTPAIGGYDLMKAARLVVDVANRRVWSRRPESATKGPIGPNPEFPVCNNSVHFSVVITEPQSAHRVVVQEPTAPSAGTPERSSTEQTLNSVAGETGQGKQASKTFGMLAPRKRRRTVGDDLLTSPWELSGSATSTDVDQPDVRRAHRDRTPQCFCVDAIQSEDEEDVMATVAEINQRYRDHVDAVRSRSVYCGVFRLR